MVEEAYTRPLKKIRMSEAPDKMLGNHGNGKRISFDAHRMVYDPKEQVT